MSRPGLDDVGARQTSQLVGVLVLVLSAIDLIAVVVRMVLEPALMVQDLPVAGLTLAIFAVVFFLNRTRFRQQAAFLFCLTPVWVNLVEGLQRPGGPVWYGLLPLAAILGAAFLRFRVALAVALLSLASALVVVVARVDAISADRGSLIVMYVALINAAALGMAVFRDRVEAKRAAEVERLSAQLAAAERLESVGRLAGGVAHDFNNLLTVMLTGAEAARAGELAALDDVQGAGERAAVLTRQLLSFSRHRGGQRVSVTVDKVVEATRPLLRRLVPENIELVLTLGSGATVLLEEQQLEQLLFNLAANARDAMPTGGRLTVKTATLTVPPGAAPPHQPGEYVTVEVQDTGAGMDEQTRARAFEPFFTTKAEGRGTGLGLATVHGIVKKAGGWVEVDSAPGKGTRVKLALPCSPAQAAAVAVAPGVPRPLRGRVLLVEDDPLVMRATARLLTELGFSVVSATRPDEVPGALAASPGPLALLVTDVVMPGGSGPDLVASLRRQLPGLPALLVSGYAEGDVEQALRQPRTRFLSKPYSRAAVVAVLQELLTPRDEPTPALTVEPA